MAKRPPVFRCFFGSVFLFHMFLLGVFFNMLKRAVGCCLSLELVCYKKCSYYASPS